MSQTRSIESSTFRFVRVDVVWALSAFLVLRLFVPSRLSVGGLGGAGSPAGLFALACAGWWLFVALQRTTPPPHDDRGHVRAAAFVFLCAVLASYLAANSRPLDRSEVSIADLSLLQIVSLLGVLMLALDGIVSRDGMVRLCRRLVWFVAAIAFLGIIQFFTGEQYVDRISIPGLSASAPIPTLAGRGGFSRASGTALHPIEFGGMLTLALPLALALAFSDRTRSAVRRWVPCAVIGFAIVISISRSAFLGMVVGMLVFLPALPRRARLAVLTGGSVLAVVVFVTIPGLSGTILGLFLGAGGDSSVQSRTGSYPLAWEFIHQYPFFGRGIGTFLPSYRILDNQYLLLLIETGFVGAIAILALLLTGMSAALRVSRMADFDDSWRLLGRGLAAGVAAGAAELAFFDGFSFPLFTALLFLCVGMSAAAERVSLRLRAEPRSDPAGAGPSGSDSMDGRP